jgi:putative membrane protein
MYWWHDSGWGWFWMMFMMVFFWAFVAVAIVFVVRGLRPGQATQPQTPSTPTADDLLAQRFARGEIDADEYHARLDALRSHVPS